MASIEYGKGKKAGALLPGNLHGRALKYPLDLENANGHYMIFNILTRKSQQKANDSVDLNIAGEGEITHGPGGTRELYNNTFTRERFFDAGLNPVMMIQDSIVLYMPDDISVNYKSNYSSENEIGAIVATAAGMADVWRGKASSSDMAKALGMHAAKRIERILGFFSLGGAEGSYELLQRQTGVAAAPLKEMVFEGIDFRTFDYSFILTPRNRKEAREIKKILDCFAYHMLPEKLGTAAALGFRVPAEFTIRYMYRGHDNNYLNHITNCVLSDMKIDYGGGEKYVTYRPDDTGAPPVTTKVTLRFEELELLDKRRAINTGKNIEGTHRTTLRSLGAEDTGEE